MVTTIGTKMATTIPPVRSEGEVVSISGEQLVPLQSSVGVEEGRREVGREQSIPLHSSVGVEEGRRKVGREQLLPLDSLVGVRRGGDRERRRKLLIASIPTDQLNY